MMPHSASWDGATQNQTSNSITNISHRNDIVAEKKDNIHIAGKCPCVTPDNSTLGHFRRRQSQQSSLAKYAMQSSGNIQELQQRRRSDEVVPDEMDVDRLRNHLDRTLAPNGDASHTNGNGHARPHNSAFKLPPTHAPQIGGSLAAALNGHVPEVTGASMALNDTPATTAPNSPKFGGHHPSTSSETSQSISLGAPMRVNSGASTPRVRPTTLDIPGLTKSKVSPDGRIAQRDVGAKLVIVMVGLPARGKSYITKKLARYLNWLQHDTRIFNVGERRRVVAGGPHSPEHRRTDHARADRGFTLSAISPLSIVDHLNLNSPVTSNPPGVAQIMLNGETRIQPPETPHEERDQNDLHKPDMGEPSSPVIPRRHADSDSAMEQNAAFFDPENQRASQIREQVARETLDELLDYILDRGGSVGILDATNSTMDRRKMVMDRIRERAGPDLNVLFLESRCVNQDLLEANMRLKLSGPDYKDMDPTIALADFKKRVQAYEKAYVPLGDYEEDHNVPYIQMIDVGRKIISHQIKGFLMAQANYYLLNFNLAPRQIWITRHGLSEDNISGKIGGDSDLAPEGHQYAKSLARFMDEKRKEWDMKELHRMQNSHFPPQPGDVTPPNPHYQLQSPTSPHEEGPEAASTTTDPADVPGFEPKPFCVWTSMLKRSIQTARYFNDEDYDTKQMRMLDELNSGVMEGLTYSCISTQYPDEYARRKNDKLHYRYPGPGGEGYLDIINRLRPVIVELERMTDHVLLIGHRSVARVLLAYFRGLKREEVADLDVPLGMLYCLEPRPYGVDFKAFAWDKGTEWFYEVEGFRLKRAEDDML